MEDNKESVNVDPKAKNIDQAIEICEGKIEEFSKAAGTFRVLIWGTIAGLCIITTVFLLSGKDTLIASKFINRAQDINDNTREIFVSLKSMTKAWNSVSKNLKKNNQYVDSLKLYTGKNAIELNNFNDQLEYSNRIIDSIESQAKLTDEDIYSKKISIYHKGETQGLFLYYLLYACFLAAFGVSVSLHRFHLREKSKMEHYYLGLLRIRIAGNNATSRFDGLVLEALTKDAFVFEPQSGIFSKKRGTIENPLPGYYPAEVLSAVINKILDKVDIKSKS